MTDAFTSQAEILGRALGSTVITMAELGSIGEEVLLEKGVTTIEDLEWYPAQLRREIHEAVYKRFGDSALRSFGFSMGDFYPQSMAQLLDQMPHYRQLMDQAATTSDTYNALQYFIEKAAANYDNATTVSQRAPGIRYGFSANRIGDGLYEFTAITTIAPHHASFSQGIIDSYLTRFISCDWDYDITFLPDRIVFSSLHSELTWLAKFTLKTERLLSARELTAQFQLARKEALLRAVMLESNRTLSQVMESIRYAGLLQRGQVPDPARVRARLRDLGVVWEQRDTIGGDLWWASPDGTGHGLSIALVDCAGHGVPGAMLSVLVIAALEKIYAAQPGINPSSALFALDAAVRKGLRQEGAESEQRENDDGCDAAIIRITAGQPDVEYSGAKIGLFQLSESGTVIHHRPARISLGYREPLAEAPPLHHLTLAPGDRLIMSSDGLTDQPGGRNGVAFGYRRLTEQLEAAAALPAPEIAERLHDALRQWQGDRSRRDDLTILAIQP